MLQSLKHRATILSSIALLIAVGCSNASAEEVTAKLLFKGKDQRLDEKYDPEVAVNSGGVIIGIALLSAQRGLSSNNLAIKPGKEIRRETVCLQTISRDGAYSSTNSYAVNFASSADIVFIPYATRHSEVVDTYRSRDALAISATRGDCSKFDRAEYFLPFSRTHLKDSNSAAVDAVVFVNGFDATDVYAVVTRTKEEPTDCDFVEVGRHTTYNFICKIKLRSPNTETDRVELRILRERFGRELPTVSVKVTGAR